MSLLTALVGSHDAVERDIAGRWPQWSHLAEEATARAYEELLTLPSNREAIERVAAAGGREPQAADVLKHWKLRAFSRLQNEVRAVQGEDSSTGPRSYVAYDAAIHDREAPEAAAEEYLEPENVLRELLMRLPEDLKPLARLRLVDMHGAPGEALSKAEALERLGWSPKQWKTRSAKLSRLLETEMGRLHTGAWCSEHRDRMAGLVVRSVLATDDPMTSAHLEYCEACNEHVAYLARELERVAVVLPPVPALAGAGLFATISAKFSALFSSGEAATATIGGGAAGGGLLTAGGALKACGGLAVGCAAWFGAPAVVEKVQADPKPPAAAKARPAPAVAAKPIATVAPVVATPSAAQVRSQERAMSRAASKAKRSARRDKRSSADAAFKVSSAARSARSAAPTQSDKALGLSSAPPAPSRSAPASAGSGGGGGGASDAPTSADKAFGLSTGGG